jgi:hypothetical protein
MTATTDPSLALPYGSTALTIDKERELESLLSMRAGLATPI